MTFRGPAKKLKSEPGLRENPVEAFPGGPRIAQISMVFLKALPEAHFSGPGGPRRRPRQILGPNRADSGLPFGPIFGLIGHFLRVCILGRILGHFWGGVGGSAGPAVLCRLGRLGMRMEFHHALLSCGVRRIYRLPPLPPTSPFLNHLRISVCDFRILEFFFPEAATRESFPSGSLFAFHLLCKRRP